MLLNFGGNIGLHGKMDALIDGFYDAKADVHAGRTLRGVGMTPEGIENNPVMYELVMELPWREHRFTRDEWLKGYVYARYGVEDEALQQVWDLLGNGIYNSPKEKIQQGTHESVFCARPGLDVYQVSSWSEMKEYYNPQDVIEAARLMVWLHSIFCILFYCKTSCWVPGKNSRLELGLKRHVQQDRPRKKKHYTNGMHVFRLLHGEIV